MPLISVIVLNYRTPQETVACVQNLQKQTIADRIEIIVVENHSEDESIGVLRNRLEKLFLCRSFETPRPLPCHAEVLQRSLEAQHGSGRSPQDDIKKVSIPLIIETPRNLGFGGGYNKGIRRACGKYILINNPAKILQNDGIEKLGMTMEHDPSIGILAPKLAYDDGTIRPSVRSFPSPLDIIIKRTPLRHIFPKIFARYVRIDIDPQTRQDVDWVVGGCLMIRRDLFDQIGGFDERFFLFFEDIDLCLRVHNKGKKVVYDPSVTALDRKRRLSGEGFFDLFLTKTGRIHLLSALKYFWKWRHKNTASFI